MTSLVFLILISSSRALTSCSNKRRSLGAFQIHSPTDPDSSCLTQRNDRRNLLKLFFISLVSPPIILPPLSHALSEDAKSSSLLEQRLQLNLMSSPPYEMESSDVYYPPYFAGTWNVSSTLSAVMAPCGEALFGGEMRLQKARDEIGTALSYRSRFIQGSRSEDDESRIVADREFNVQEIAKASMGNSAVLNIVASPNLVSCTLFPTGSDQLIRADLVILARRQEKENRNETKFVCSEVSQQIISTVEAGTALGQVTTNKNRQLKQIETISLFQRLDTTEEQIQCIQRTATFLVPSQQDPIALKLWQLSQGRPIDVRFYDVVYTKINT